MHSYRHFPIVNHQSLQLLNLNHVLATFPESGDVCPPVPVLLVGLVDKTVLLGLILTALVSLTTYHGFRSSMHRLPNQILGISRTYRSSPSKSPPSLWGPSAAERLRYVLFHSPLRPRHPRLCIHLSLFLRWNTFLETRKRLRVRLSHRLQSGSKACSLHRYEDWPSLSHFCIVSDTTSAHRFASFMIYSVIFSSHLHLSIYP